jgi:hypothetical protein
MMTDYKKRKKGTVVEQTAGALKSDIAARSPREERKAVEEAIAEDVIRRMAG